MKNWINIKNEKPQYYKPVLVYRSGTPYMNIVWLASDGDNDIYTELNSDFIIDDITYWMPLPEPPSIF